MYVSPSAISTAAGDVRFGVLVEALYAPLKGVDNDTPATSVSTYPLTLACVGILVAELLAKSGSLRTHVFELTSVSSFRVMLVPKLLISDSV